MPHMPPSGHPSAFVASTPTACAAELLVVPVGIPLAHLLGGVGRVGRSYLVKCASLARPLTVVVAVVAAARTAAAASLASAATYRQRAVAATGMVVAATRAYVCYWPRCAQRFLHIVSR